MFFWIDGYAFLLVVLQIVWICSIIVGTCIRCYKFKNSGLNRLDAPKPTAYIVKVYLQITMILMSVALASLTGIDFFSDKGSHEEAWLIWRFSFNLVAALLWLTSIFMMRFEYKRALGHSWYLHKCFWFTSFFFTSGCLLYHIYGGPDKGKDMFEDSVFYLLAV